jgi:hypothetical protein
MTTAESFLKKHSRTHKWLAITLAIYSLLGFFLITWQVESQTTNLLQKRLVSKSSFESVYFNPYTFYFEIKDFDIKTASNEELFQPDNIFLNFQPSSLLPFRFQHSELFISNIDLYFGRESETENTITNLIENWASFAARSDNSEAEPRLGTDSSKITPIEILTLSASGFNLHISDEVMTTPRQTTLSLANKFAEV